MRRYLVAVTILVCLWQQWDRQIVPYANVYQNDLVLFQRGEAIAPYHARVLLYWTALALSGGQQERFFTVLAALDLVTLAAALVSLYALLCYVFGGERGLIGLLIAELLFVTFVVYPGGFIAWSWLEMALINSALMLCWRVFSLPRWS